MKKIIIPMIAILTIFLLLASMATAAIDLNSQEFKIKKEKIKSLFKSIDNEAHKYINENKSPQEFIDQSKKHTKELDAIVVELESATGTSLNDVSREEFKQLILTEHYDKIRQEIGLAKFKEDTKDVSMTNINPIPNNANTMITIYSANLPANTYYPIHNFSQVKPDVKGGSGFDVNFNPYNVNGNNSLYNIIVENGRNCIFGWCYANYTKYTLYFLDEDHPDPTIDILYDIWRQIIYGRIQDVESFVVTNGIIDFNGIWDNNRAYAEVYGQHGAMTRSYKANSTVNISNVWNHAMDTLDKNTDMDKVLWNIK